MKRVFISGEGSNELGRWEDPPAYRAADPRHPDTIEGGVLEALCRREIPEGWRVADAAKWDKLAKRPTTARVRGPSPEHQNVLKLALLAQESGCDALIFARDTDGDAEREHALNTGLTAAIRNFPDLSIGGGPVINRLEDWIAAMLGMKNTEHLSKSRIEAFLIQRGIRISDKDTAALLAVVATADLSALPPDAASLRLWLSRVRAALT